MYRNVYILIYALFIVRVILVFWDETFILITSCLKLFLSFIVNDILGKNGILHGRYLIFH